MCLASGNIIWEIPDSDEELPDAEPIDVQDDVSSVDSEEARYDYRKILKFFPNGRGLLPRPTTTADVNEDQLPTLRRPREVPVTEEIQKQPPRSQSESNGRSHSSSTKESTAFSELYQSTDDEAPVRYEPRKSPIREETVEQPSRTESKTRLSITGTETSSDDGLPFLQNPEESPRTEKSQEQSQRRSSSERHLLPFSDEFDANLDPARPLHDDPLHLQEQRTTSVTEELDSQLRAVPTEESAAINGSEKTLVEEPRKREGRSATIENKERPQSVSSYALSASTKAEASLDDDLPLARRRSRRTARRPTVQGEDSAWSTSTARTSPAPDYHSERLLYNITAETNPPPSTPIPTRRTSSPSPKIIRDGRQIHPWPTHQLDPSIAETYATILAGVHKVVALYTECGDNLYENEPRQFPNVRSKFYDFNEKKTKIKNSLRHCRCLSKTQGRKDKSTRQRCYDPACEVLGGWYHLSCLSEDELRDMLSVEHWICRPCMARRAAEGFPELHSHSLMEDRYRRIVRMVLSWTEKVKEEVALVAHRRVDGGLTEHERAYAAKVDRSLRERKLWPKEGDKVLRMYHWWARVR